MTLLLCLALTNSVIVFADCKYVEYDEPIKMMENGHVTYLLGYYEDNDLSVKRDYREYDRWYVYDDGIVEHWSWLSNPYFIKSVARGETYEKSTEVTVSISADFDSDIPSKAMSLVKSKFKISASGSKKVTEKITLSGPSGNYSSRDFYYQKGRHTHEIRVKQKHYSNWDGLLWEKEYGTFEVGVPAIKHYSVDE